MTDHDQRQQDEPSGQERLAVQFTRAAELLAAPYDPRLPGVERAYFAEALRRTAEAIDQRTTELIEALRSSSAAHIEVADGDELAGEVASALEATLDQVDETLRHVRAAAAGFADAALGNSRGAWLLRGEVVGGG